MQTQRLATTINRLKLTSYDLCVDDKQTASSLLSKIKLTASSGGTMCR